MSDVAQTQRTYPWTDVIDGREITFRLMCPEDRDGVLGFTNSLPEDDLMFLRLDITKGEVVDEWIRHIRAGRTISVLAMDDGELVGYGNLHFEETLWTRHLGQVRILVRSDRRRMGLGRRLAVEMFQLAKEKGLERLFVQMAADQPFVRQLFEDLGFRAEALLTDWVKDRKGRTHDLLIMSHHVGDFGS
ncbi:MAG: hypothetical protein AMXMBFR4_31600 [Candidatus Hydrogenedentota bacterium]